MKLSDIQCKTAKPQNKPYKLSDGGGMYLEVMPNGSKYWRLKYRVKAQDTHKEKRLALGVYPDTSLKEARERRDDAKKLLQNGRDPSLEKQRLKTLADQDNANTFKAVALEWYEQRKDIWRPRYAAEVITRLENDIFPYLGNYPIKEIDPPLLLHVVRKIESRGAHELAKRQLQKCGEIFRYAIACGKASRDPSRDIGDALKPIKKEHFASIDFQELPEFLRVMNSNKARLYPTTLNALKLIMLTFVRTNELINAKWEEINFDRKEWIIPASRMKMGKSHIVPLADQAIEILQAQEADTGQWEHVFPSPVKPQKSISNNTILGALKRMGYQGRMTGHGFRSLAMSTIKQELGYRHEVVDRQLAHVPRSKIDQAYDRAMFLEERKKMMQDWADYIDSLK